MTLEKLIALIEDRLDGYGLVITDYDMLEKRIKEDTTADEVFDYKDCHTGDCQHVAW